MQQSESPSPQRPASSTESPPEDQPPADSQAEDPIELEDDAPISLVDEEKPGGANVRAIGAASRGLSAHKEQFARPLNTTGTGATRCRIFHSKIAQTPLERMEQQINEWLDGSEAEIKHVGHVIGDMQGKTAEPNLIVMVWY